MADAQIEAAETPEEYFYAYFNRGSSQVEMNDFYGAAQSYDFAWNMYYPDIETNRRPYRIVWYQTGPYYAYYYSGRYYDVISLAETGVQWLMWRSVNLRRRRKMLRPVSSCIPALSPAKI